jgi:hypothetical protein
MKNYSREELEKLATENPNELALLFAQKVVRDKYAVASTWEDSRDVQIMKNKAYQVAQGMLTDWTAVINAGKKAGIHMLIEPVVDSPLGQAAIAWRIGQISAQVINNVSEGWPDCAALMIVMIEVEQGRG